LDGLQNEGLVKSGGDFGRSSMIWLFPNSPEGWHLLIDTNLPEQNEQLLFPFGQRYSATGRSALLFLLQKAV
jgi:hypothetical protein